MTRPPRTSWLWDRKTDLRRLKLIAIVGSVLLLGEWCVVQTGAIHEAQARLNPSQPLPAQPAAGRWVRMPASPFVDIGWQGEAFSGERMLLAWQAAGLNARQASILVGEMQDHFSPVVMGVEDPALEAQVQARAQLVAEHWKLQWPQPFARLAHMQHAGWQPKVPLSTEDMGPWRRPYEQLTQPRSQLPRLHRFNFDMKSMAQAKGALARSVAGAGLRGLRLWYTDLETPLQVEATVAGLDAAGREMTEITGWRPGALGLYGRVFLTLRKPEDTETEGATHDQDPGQLTIECNWDTLSHEWFHALDLHLQREAFLHPGHNALSSNLGPLRQTRTPALVEAWRQARIGVIDDQGAWKLRRWKYALRHLDFYWVSDAETMAYAFAQYAMLDKPEALDSSWITDLPTMRTLVPDEAEARQQAKTWKRLLAQVRPWVEPSQPAKVAAGHHD